MLPAAAVILDTNVFVAAGFNRRSASARIVEQIRAGTLRMLWTEETRRETQYVLGKIPRLSWEAVAPLFREEDRYGQPLDAADFAHIRDPDDRKFAALSHSAGAVLLTNDGHLLGARELARGMILTPADYWRRYHG